MPATYINHYAANGGVVVPQFGGTAAETDRLAIETLQQVLPRPFSSFSSFSSSLSSSFFDTHRCAAYHSFFVSRDVEDAAASEAPTASQIMSHELQHDMLLVPDTQRWDHDKLPLCMHGPA